MSSVIPGDKVDLDGQTMIVVDVSPGEEGMAVLRKEDDLYLNDPKVVPAEDLTVTGHLESLEGWEEHEPGVWERDTNVAPPLDHYRESDTQEVTE